MKKLLPILFFLFVCTTVRSQWTSDTSVNTTVRDSSGAISPKMASDRFGNTFVTWFELDFNTNLILKMQMLDPNGYALWAQGGQIISLHPQNSTIFPYDLKVDNNGHPIVAFQDERSGRLDIVVYKLDNTGVQLWGGDGITLTDSNATEGISPVIGITAMNDVYIAWSCDSNGVNKWVSCERITEAGTVTWATNYRKRDPQLTINYSRPKLLPINNYDIQLIYIEQRGSIPNDTNTIYAQHIDSSGINIWANDIQVSTLAIPFTSNFKPVDDLHGGFFVAFETPNLSVPSLNDVYVQHVDSVGNLWSPTGTQADHSSTDSKFVGASCYIDSTKNFFVLLRMMDFGQTIAGVSIQKFDSVGTALLGVQAISLIPQNGGLYEPLTIADVGDGLIFSATYDLGGYETIIAMKVGHNAHIIWNGNPTTISNIHSLKEDLDCGTYYNHNLVFVWYDDRASDPGIFAQNITGDGGVGGVTGIPVILSQNILFYPNPSKNPTLYLTSANYLVKVYDAKGMNLFSKKIQSASYTFNELADLPEGLYFISIQNENWSGIVKWSKK